MINEITIQCERVESVVPCELPNQKTGFEFELANINEEGMKSILSQIEHHEGLEFIQDYINENSEDVHG